MTAGYSFQTTVPPGFTRDYPVSVYGTEAHRALQADTWKSFWLLRPGARQIVAEIHFALQGSQALSPARAPFGSVWFSRRLAVADLKEFLIQVEQELLHTGVTHIKIVAPPAPYQPLGPVAHAFFIESGYAVSRLELAAFLPVSEQDFRTRLNSWELRKLRHAETAGITCRHLPHHRLSDIYRFLQQCRAERGHAMSMTEEQVLSLDAGLPGAVVLFEATQGEERAAAVLGICDHDRMLYTFYYGHAAAWNAASPVVLLLEYVYRYGRQAGMEWINLGTSTVNAATQVPLLQFKLNLGTELFHKFTFTKTLG